MSRQPTVLHLFSGAGGGALGFHRAGFRSVGALDISPLACEDVENLTGEKATVADLEHLTPAELAEICGERPDVVFTSPPCKGYSGCLALDMSKSDKYLALNSLAFRGIWLALEAWETPPPLILLENVPRIQSRGRQWLSRLKATLHAYGYAVTMGTHDCGELGGLAQNRRRFLLVARHMEQVPAYLREPARKRVRTIGEVLGELPVPTPGSTAGGDMHRLPRMIPMNWVRLALIPGAGDWRDLPEQVALPPRKARQNGGYGVEPWTAPAHAIVAEGTVQNTRASVADPRLPYPARRGIFGVRPWDEASRVITGNPRMGCGPFALCDPRLHCEPRSGAYGISPWTEPSKTVVAAASHDNSSVCVPDPRVPDSTSMDVDWDSKRPLHLVIRALDGTWHRPMTTLELAALQGFPVRHNGEWLRLAGNSHARWREAIGNAVPPPTAEAIARNCRITLAASAKGEFSLSSEAIWVDQSRPSAAASPAA